jgi:uncharacterized protein
MRSFKLAIWLTALFHLLASVALADSTQPIIDVHLHLYEDGSLPAPPHPGLAGEGSLPATQAELIAQTLAQMDKHNVVMALVHDAPENIQAIRSREPGRFLAFPDLKADRPNPTVEEFDSGFASGDWSGIGEIRTVYHGFHPNDASLEPYYELADQYDVPVLWHTAGSFPGITRRQPAFRMDLGRPLHWEDVLVGYPDLRVVLVHAGYPFLDEMIAVLHLYPSVYVDVGAIAHFHPRREFYRYFGALIDAGFGQRILFGSDQMGWPDTIGHSIQVIKEAPWPEAVKRDILYNNAARFLRLSEDQIRRHHEQPQASGE